MCSWNMISLQDANSPIMENLIFFHDETMFIAYLIIMMIFYMFIILIKNKLNNKLILNNQTIELLWTIAPMMILMILAIPSLKILYLTDELLNPKMTIKIIGHQWYWTYEYSDFIKFIEFNSYMINDFNPETFRLLDVDNRMIIPYHTNIRLLITSNDVIHSWTIPSLGIKIDAIPGRINQTFLYCNRPGLYYGQCSEICGTNHSFMPIVIESTSPEYFIHWMNKI